MNANVTLTEKFESAFIWKFLCLYIHNIHGYIYTSKVFCFSKYEDCSNAVTLFKTSLQSIFVHYCQKYVWILFHYSSCNYFICQIWCRCPSKYFQKRLYLILMDIQFCPVWDGHWHAVGIKRGWRRASGKQIQ
jgi:hypothetical protein